jgi:hypothetical protein
MRCKNTYGKRKRDRSDKMKDESITITWQSYIISQALPLVRNEIILQINIL